MGFAEKWRELRQAAGLSQPQLAEKAGMTRDGIARLEQGRRKPTWESGQALADAPGVSCEALRCSEAPADEAKRPPGRTRMGG